MAEKRILKENGVDIIPITHETAVITEEGTTIVEKYATKEEVNSQVDIINSQVSTIDNKVGELSSLQTSDKSNITGAINELFQFGNRTKQKLVDTLIAKDVEASTSETFESLLDKFKELTFEPALPSSAENFSMFTVNETLPTILYDSQAVTIGDYIYITGGCDASDYVDINYCYDPINDTITTRTSLPMSLYKHKAVEYNSKMYVMGGINALAAKDVNYCYDPTTDSWSTKTVMPAARCGHTLVSTNGKLYITGGSIATSYTATAQKTHYSYDPSTDSWTTLTAMTAVRKRGHAVVIGDNIHYIGGLSSSASQKTHYIYSISAGTWSTGTSTTQTLDEAAICYLNNRIYLINGHYYSSSSSSGYRTNIYYYDFNNTSSWTSVTSFHTSYAQMSFAVFNNMLYLFGGYMDGGYDAGINVFVPIGGE